MMRILYVLVSVFSLGTSALADANWAIQPDWASCFLENIDAYQDSSGDPIVIILAACPEADRMEALRRIQQNSGSVPLGPTVFILQDGSERLQDEVIVYTREELACLKKLEITTSETPVLLPQSPCDP